MEKSEPYPPPYPTQAPMSGPGPQPAPGQYSHMPPPMIQVQPAYVQAVGVPGVMMVPHPVAATCPSCNQTVTTRVEYESGALTWIAVGVLSLVGCIFGCCLIPLCVDGCKDVVHYCPNCTTFLGKYRRL